MYLSRLDNLITSTNRCRISNRGRSQLQQGSTHGNRQDSCHTSGSKTLIHKNPQQIVKQTRPIATQDPEETPILNGLAWRIEGKVIIR